MDKFPLCWNGKALGEIEVKEESLYTCFDLRCRLPRQGLWCVWLVGENGDLRLGVPDVRGEDAWFHRRFSSRMTAPLGRILQGELRPAATGEAVWEPMKATAFRTPWLRHRLQEVKTLTRQEGGHRFVAVPYDAGAPFPLTAVFCFARIRRIGGKEYAVFAFDAEEWPVFFE